MEFHGYQGMQIPKLALLVGFISKPATPDLGRTASERTKQLFSHHEKRGADQGFIVSAHSVYYIIVAKFAHLKAMQPKCDM